MRCSVALVLAIAAPLTLAACGSTDSAAADPGDDAAVQGTGGSPTADAGNGGALTGGTGGSPGTGGDTPAADAGPPLPDLSAPAGDPCPAACARLSACITETCGGTSADFSAAADAACAHECGANPSLALQITDAADCAGVIALAGTSIGAPLTDGCPTGSDAFVHHPVCDVFGERFSTCVVERCANAAEYASTFTPAYARFCDNSINGGDFTEGQLNALISPNTPCNSPVLGGVLDSATAEDGAIRAFCDNGPAVDLQTCLDACDTVAPCLTQDTGYGIAQDPAVCAFVCLATNTLPAAVWACGAALPDDATCDTSLACLDPNAVPEGPLPECEVVAARVTACTLEQCPGIASVSEGHTLAARGACNDAIHAAPDTRPQYQAITADTPCDDPTLSGYVSAYVSGPDARICQDGPVNDIETLCRPACAVVAPCLPPEGDLAALRDLAACEYYCAQAPDQVPAEAWSCFAAAQSCGDAFACVQ